MKRLLLLGLLLLSTLANAQYVSTRLGTIEPYRGMYYDRNQSGSGLSVDIGPGGMLFLQFATYDSAGSQVNYITQPNFVPTSEAQRAATGVIGTATDQMYAVTNGQCPGCPYTEPQIHLPNLTPTFTWTRPRHVDMTFQQNGQTYTYHFDAGNYEGKNDEEFLPGTFAISVVYDSSAYPNGGGTHGMLATGLDLVKVVPASFSSVTAAPGADPSSVMLPPAGASLYVLQCGQVVGTPTNAATKPCQLLPNAFSSAANDATGTLTQETLLWFDPATGTAGMETVNTDGTVGLATVAGDLYITPGSLTAHLGVEGSNPAGSTWYKDGMIWLGVTLTRLPDPAVRDCFSMNPTPTSSQYQYCGQ
jgi:hypothetical protein